MRQRNHKSFIYCILAFLASAIVLPLLSGCADDPDNAAAKKVQQTTAEALETAAKDKNYEQAREKIVSSLNRNPAKGLSKDSGRLASGSLWLAQGRQSQSNLDLKTLPIRSTVNSFEKLLRESESLLLEKERIVSLLARGNEEVAELEQLLNGDGQTAGLKTQLQEAQKELEALQDAKSSAMDEKEKAQAVLDDYQGQADALLRKAELARGDEKLKLEKDSVAILHDRKEYYIQAQAAENKVTALNGQIALSQTIVDGLNQSIQETEDRIDAVSNSQTRAALNQQKSDIEAIIRDNQGRMVSIANDIRVGMDAYKDEVTGICGVFENAIAEFEAVNSRGTEFAATLRLAESCHCAAMACASSVLLATDVSIDLQDLMETADPTITGSMNLQLPIQAAADSDQVQKAMNFFDQAIEAYQKAFDRAGALSGSLASDSRQKVQDAKSSVLKSQLLAVDNKKRLAERLQQYEIVDAMTARENEIVEKGQEFGVSFTQSEAMKLIESGISYTPSLPVNLEVFAEDLKKRLSEWKRLPLAQQEAAVSENLQTIEESVNRYGQELANELESLKQEMLAAQQRGFQDAQPGAANDPNNF